MDAGNGRSFEVGDLLTQRCGVGSWRQDAVESLERKREHEIVESRLDFSIAAGEIENERGIGVRSGRVRRVAVKKVGAKTFQRRAELQLAAAGADVVSGSVVERGEGNGGNAHVAGRGRLHGFADDLRSGRNRDAVEVFAEGADEDRLPETFDGAGGLSALLQPFGERFSGVGLRG